MAHLRRQIAPGAAQRRGGRSCRECCSRDRRLRVPAINQTSPSRRCARCNDMMRRGVATDWVHGVVTLSRAVEYSLARHSHASRPPPCPGSGARCWGEPRRDSVSCFHSRLWKRPRQNTVACLDIALFVEKPASQHVVRLYASLLSPSRPDVYMRPACLRFSSRITVTTLLNT